MVYIGVALISLSALLLCREYIAYLNRRLAECEGFLSFIEHMQTEVGCFSKPICELCREYSAEEISEFISYINEGEDLLSAYMKCEAALAVGEREKEILKTLFASFGKGYLEESMRQISAAHTQLAESVRSFREECPKKKKLAASLFACAAVGMIILVI